MTVVARELTTFTGTTHKARARSLDVCMSSVNVIDNAAFFCDSTSISENNSSTRESRRATKSGERLSSVHSRPTELNELHFANCSARPAANQLRDADARDQ